jgi:hypothetical protein
MHGPLRSQKEIWRKDNDTRWNKPSENTAVRSPEDVKKEVEDLIIDCGYNGGLVVFPSNVIQPDTSVENIITCFHTAKNFKNPANWK